MPSPTAYWMPSSMFTIGPPFWSAGAADPPAVVYPSLPFTLTFDEDEKPAVGTQIGTAYAAAYGITALPGVKQADYYYTDTTIGTGIPDAPGPVPANSQFAHVFSGTTFGFQFDAALGVRKVSYARCHGSSFGTLTVKTSLGVTESFAVFSDFTLGWPAELMIDLDALAVGTPTLTGGYLTEFSYSGSGGTYACDGITLAA